MKRDAYAEATATILGLMETEGTNWIKPWASLAGPRNALTKRAYSGINVMLLGVRMAREGWDDPRFATFKQWKDAGYMVTKGSKSTCVVLFKPVTKRDPATGIEETFPVLRSFNVFNVAQVEALADAKPLPELVAPDGAIRGEAIDQWVRQTGVQIRWDDAAFYRRQTDAVHMPRPETFYSTEGYYGTLFHELTHWTGAKGRCAREFGKRFGDDAYAFEELVAELGAAFMCQAHGVTSEPRADHAKYLNSWLKVLRHDKKAIFTAAAKAQQAVEFCEAQQAAVPLAA